MLARSHSRESEVAKSGSLRSAEKFLVPSSNSSLRFSSDRGDGIPDQIFGSDYISIGLSGDQRHPRFGCPL
jgi:hypothetical protein